MWAVAIIGLVAAAELIELETPRIAAENAELHEYLLEAGAQHPGLERRHAKWRAALERIPQATAFDDPVLSYAHFLQSDTNRLRVGLSQSFPWFGTRAARGDTAAYAAEAALAQVYVERDRIFAAVKKAYFEYAYLRARLEVTESQAEILSYMEEVERSRFSVGGSGQHDLLRVQIERDELENRRRELLDLRAVLSTDLAQALGRAPNTKLPWPQSFAQAPEPPDRVATLAAVRNDNPELITLAAARQSKQSAIVVADKKRYPDFTLGIEGMARKNDADHISLALSFNLPIWRGKTRAAIAEARYEEAAVMYQKDDRTRMLERMAIRILFDFEDAQRRAELFSGSLIPKASQTYESLQSAYALGTSNVALIDLLDSVNTLLEFELEGRRATRDMHLAAAELENIMGGPWSPSDAPETAHKNN